MWRQGDVRGVKALEQQAGRLALSAGSGSAYSFRYYYYPCPMVGGFALHGSGP